MISGLSGGGAEGVCVRLANELSRRGWSVSLLVLNLNGALRLEELSKTVELISLGSSRALFSFIPILSYFKKNKTKKVLVFNHQLAVILVLIKKIYFRDLRVIARNISTLSHKRNIESSFWHKYIVDSFVGFFYKHVDRVITQSDGMKRDLVAFYGLKDAKVTTIYNPIRYVSSDAVPNIEKEIEAEYILCVGRLEKVKAFHYALEAFSRVAQDYPNLRLRIIGQGSLEKVLKDQAQELKISDRVDFKGYKSDILQDFIGAKLTLQTSLYEGFPNVLAESISLGVPVVAFNCPSGPDEIIFDKVNGYLIKVGDISELVKKITSVLSGSISRKDVLLSAQKFNSEVIFNSYERILSE